MPLFVVTNDLVQTHLQRLHLALLVTTVPPVLVNRSSFSNLPRVLLRRKGLLHRNLSAILHSLPRRGRLWVGGAGGESG